MKDKSSDGSPSHVVTSGTTSLYVIVGPKGEFPSLAPVFTKAIELQKDQVELLYDMMTAPPLFYSTDERIPLGQHLPLTPNEKERIPWLIVLNPRDVQEAKKALKSRVLVDASEYLPEKFYKSLKDWALNDMIISLIQAQNGQKPKIELEILYDTGNQQSKKSRYN